MLVHDKGPEETRKTIAAIAAPWDSSTVVVVTSFNRLRLWTALHTLRRPARTSS